MAQQTHNSGKGPLPVGGQGTCMRMTWRGVLKWWFCGALAVVLCLAVFLTGCGRKQQRAEGPNVVIISIDTLRADHVSCYGYERETTPNIDRLASQGHRFQNAYTTMPTTLPAHASLFTSLYPRQLSVRRNGERVPADVRTLAEILRSSGYATGGFVSAIVMHARHGISKGFRTYEDVEGVRLAEETLARATAWLQKQGGRPFFLFLHLYDPHWPYHAPEPYRTKFGAPDSAAPPAKQFVPDPSQFTEQIVQESIAAYDAEIAYADEAVGALLRELAQMGVEDRTIVVLLSDHGESLGELLTRYGYAFAHGEFLYAHQLQIPLIIRMPEEPSQENGVVRTAPVSIVDIMPTILDILEIDPVDTMAGRSLLPVLKGEQATNRSLFSERRTIDKLPKPFLAGADYSIIRDGWHLIFSTNRGIELYNMVEDPAEVSDLVQEREKIDALTGELRRWLDQLKPLFGPSGFETDEEAIEGLKDLGYAK